MLGPIFMGGSKREDCHLYTEISKRRTIMQATVWLLDQYLWMSDIHTLDMAILSIYQLKNDSYC